MEQTDSLQILENLLSDKHLQFGCDLCEAVTIATWLVVKARCEGFLGIGGAVDPTFSPDQVPLSWHQWLPSLLSETISPPPGQR